MKFVYLLFFTLTATFSFMSSCKPGSKDVVGIYKARHNKGDETIEFKKDSTYIHLLKTGDETKKQTGKWYLNKDNLIVINDWLTWISPTPNDKSLNVPVMIVVPFNDNAIMMFAEDEDYNFYK